MRNLKQLFFAAIVSLIPFSISWASDGSSSSDSPYESRKGRVTSNSLTHQYEPIQPYLGRGYISYSLPAIDSCRCANDCCFHPRRYYCGGKKYRKQWYRKWFRAHLGRGSMLDDYACECVYPTAGRTYLQTLTRKVRPLGQKPFPSHPASSLPSPSSKKTWIESLD